MKFRFTINEFCALLLFIICLNIGFNQALKKPLWDDEINTQVITIEPLSFADILTLKIKEGNSSPLFYTFQKAVVTLAKFKTPTRWSQSTDTRDSDLPTRLILRVVSNLFMSLAIISIFYYFSKYYSLGMGVYSLCICLSSFMVWSYWVEARPYSLWVFLTTLQSLLFLSMIEKRVSIEWAWKRLTAVHLLLSFTVIFSLIQVTIISILLWFTTIKTLKKYLLMFIAPSIISIFYFMNSKKIDFWFKDGPMDLINANIPKDRFLIIFIFIVSLILYKVFTKNNMFPKIANRLNLTRIETRPYFIYLLYVCMLLGGYGLVLLSFLWKDTHGASGFQVSNRYFIALTPVGIIAITLFSSFLFKMSKWKMARIFVVICLGLLLFVRFSRTFALIEI